MKNQFRKSVNTSTYVGPSLHVMLCPFRYECKYIVLVTLEFGLVAMRNKLFPHDSTQFRFTSHEAENPTAEVGALGGFHIQNVRKCKDLKRF